MDTQDESANKEEERKREEEKQKEILRKQQEEERHEISCISTFMQYVAKLVDDQHFIDVTIYVIKETDPRVPSSSMYTYKGHRLMLSRLDYFKKALLDSRMKESREQVIYFAVYTKDSSPKLFQTFFNCVIAISLYAIDEKMLLDHALGLYDLAVMTRYTGLITKINSILKKNMDDTILENCLDYLMTIPSLSAHHYLAETCLRYAKASLLKSNTKSVSKSISKLPYDMFIKYIQAPETIYFSDRCKEIAIEEYLAELECAIEEGKNHNITQDKVNTVKKIKNTRPIGDYYRGITYISNGSGSFQFAHLFLDGRKFLIEIIVKHQIKTSENPKENGKEIVRVSYRVKDLYVLPLNITVYISDINGTIVCTGEIVDSTSYLSPKDTEQNDNRKLIPFGVEAKFIGVVVVVKSALPPNKKQKTS